MTGESFPGRLAISVSRQGAATLVHAEGEVDLDNAEQLASVLRSAGAEQAGTVVLDLTGVPFMDSSGLKTLLVAHGDLGERLVLAVSPDSPVETLLGLAEVRDRFAVHATPENAIGSLRGSG